MLGFSQDVDSGALAAYNAKLKEAALADPALGAELQKQAQKKPFNSNLVLQKLTALGLQNPPKGAWISGGEGAKEPTDPFWTKALPVMGAALGGAAAAGAFSGAGAAAGGASAAGPAVSPLVPSTLPGLVPSMAGAAAPTGGILSRLGDMGDMFSQAAGANAEGRRNDNMDNLTAATANNRARVDVGEFNMNAPVTRAQQVAKGDLMGATIPQSARTGGGRDVSFSGGIGPQLFGADTTAAGDALKRQSLDALLNKTDQIDPQIATPQDAGLGEDLMAGAGMGFNILNTLGKWGKR